MPGSGIAAVSAFLSGFGVASAFASGWADFSRSETTTQNQIFEEFVKSSTSSSILHFCE